MTPTPSIYTAAQIAAALGRKRQNIALRLKGMTPDGHALASGNQAQAWAFMSLPLEMRNELDAESAKRGCRNAETMLSDPATRWQAPLPLAQIAPACIDRATRLQSALATALHRQHESGLSQGALETIGLADYKTAFGHEISGRHWRNLFDRTVQRDGGAEAWHRVEIYMDESAFKPAPARTVQATAKVGAEFEPIRERVAGFRDPQALRTEERMLLWEDILLVWAHLVESEHGTKTSKEQLFDFLMAHVPALSQTRDGLRKTFQRKWDKWEESGRKASSLSDGRRASVARNKTALTDEARLELLRRSAMTYDGEMAPAFRDVVALGLIPGLHSGDYSRKSHVPQSIREELGHQAGELKELHQGPKNFNLNFSRSRDWSDVFARDWWQGDDVTLEVYFFVPDGDGGFRLTRGQFLHMIDVRSRKILNWVLIPEKGYKAVHIRTLMNRTCRNFGMPRKGFWFERGMWKSSHMVTGGMRGADDMTANETEAGFKDMGLEFLHANRPQTKAIEGVNGQFQALLRGEIGWVGPNEMTRPMERVNDDKRLVESGKVHPQGRFHSMEQWIVRLQAHVARYNATPQEGRLLKGMSPDEAFLKLDNEGDPTTRLDAQSEYLLSCYCTKRKVQREGIRMKKDKYEDHLYASAALSPLIGREMLIFWNPELTEGITVTDMQRRNPIYVPLTPDAPAIGATSEQLKASLGPMRQMQSATRAIYKECQLSHPQKFRQLLVGAEEAELGREIIKHAAANEAKQREEGGRARKAQRLAKTTGFAPDTIARDESSLAAGDRLAAFQSQFAQDGASDEL